MLLLVIGCISEYNVPLSPRDQKTLFVDGNIIANTEASFYIGQSFSLNNDTVPPESYVTDATVSIIGSDGYQSPPAVYQGQGIYRLPVGALEDAIAYGIRIEQEGAVYQSALTPPLRTPDLDTVHYVQQEAPGTIFFYLSTHDDREEPTFFRWTYTEDWETTAPFAVSVLYNPERNELYADTYSTPYFYCWKQKVSDQFLLGSTESLTENKIIDHLLYQIEPGDDRFWELYCLTLTQTAISRGAYEYFQALSKIKEEIGSLFAPQPAEIIGNMQCISHPSRKIIGYVEALHNVSGRRIFITPGQLIVPVNRDKIQCEKDILFNDRLMEAGWTYRDIYRIMNYRPISVNPEFYPRLVPYQWAPATCTECTANGGTKVRPDFWPNDHY
jgi:hypothetical protein